MRTMKPLQLQQAKEQFCSVADKAANGKPQLVTKHGRPHVWIVGADEWQKTKPKKRTLLEALRSCPVPSDDLDLRRSDDYPRKIKL